MIDRRLSKRFPSILEGRIRSTPDATQFSCTIRDLSESGARIWFPEPANLGGEFELEIPKLGQTMRARLVWSKGREHGIEFLERLRKSEGESILDLLERIQREPPVSNSES
ncbi:PilZ domain-containing protein [Microvirga sp. GCM10011540]|uniref:PilZ domain-containing protein n=1 Tax=Microvirga sp. GCM10011540 TaxID=3317338 RepID=UPI00361D0468